MTYHRTALAFLIGSAIGSLALAEEPSLRTGLYEIGFTLELPHLERYAIARTATVCVEPEKLGGGTPLPVLTGNKAFDNCSIENLKSGENRLTYNIVCAGRAAARAVATYDLQPDKFRGRVAIVLGAKNMTMTEVQSGRRLGSCKLARK